MKTAGGYPVICYGTKNRYHKAHSLCKRCAIYTTPRVPVKPTYRMEGIHNPYSKHCPLFEPKKT